MPIRRLFALTSAALFSVGGFTACSSTAGPDPDVPTTGVGALVITSAPAGFTRRSDASAGTGAVDLERAASTDGSSDARTALVSEGFRRGWAALWTKGDAGDLVASQVYEFAAPTGATAEQRRVLAALAATPGTVHRFAVAGIPAGGGVEVTAEGHTTATVVAATGRHTLQVVCSSTSPGSLREQASTVARDQYDRLDGDGQ